MSELIVETHNLSKTYGKHTVLKDISLSVEQGEIVAVIGPSGAGKSTLLKLLDGLEKPTEGTVNLFSEELNKHSVRKLRSRTGMLFQKTILFDRTVEENITLGLSYRHIPAAERKKRTSELLAEINMESYAKHRGRTLSGGEGQRVAFARVLVTKPELLFLDEPTANLDPLATAALEEMILRENHAHKTTVIINTHDQAQAQRLADRVIVLIDGTIRQVGTPDDIWYHPADSAAARFVGFQNIIPCSIHDGMLSFGTAKIPTEKKDMDGFMMIRAEDITLSKTEGNICGTVISLTRRGAFIEIEVDAGCTFSIRIPHKEYTGDIAIGNQIYLSWNSDALIFSER